MTALAPVTLLCAGAAVLAWPGRGSPTARRVPHNSAPGPGDARRERVMTVLAVAALGAALVLVVGIRAGVPAAVVVCPSVAAVLTWLRARPARTEPDRTLALSLDLAAAVLRSGRTVADALLAAAPAARPAVATALVRVSRLLALGAEPREAWSAAGHSAGAVLDPVVAVAIRSHASGIRLADAFERLAVEVRAECAAAALARAQRAGVRAMGPLAACFLPSFVCLGIVPVVVGIAATALHGAG